MNRTSRILTLAVVAVVSLGAGYLTHQSVQATKAEARLVATSGGEAVLALTLPDMDGVEQSLAQWRGNVLVVNYWATWCPPCIKEIPEFSAVSRRYADAPVQFVGISIDTLENVQSFDETFQVPYPLLIGSHQTLRLSADLGNAPQAMPFTIILDQQGNMRHVKLGTLSEEELEGKILALLTQ